MVREMRALAPFILAIFLVLSPGLAGARPGLGGSMGSRGSHSWSAPPSTAGSPYGASPFSRSMTPNSASNYGSSYGGFGGGYRRPFGGGMLGGLLGAGLFGMLLGGGFFGFHGGFGFLGLLLQLFLLYLLARWVMTRFLGMPAMAGPGGFARSMFPPLNLNASRPGASPLGARPPGAGPIGASRGRGTPISLTSGDYQMFSQLLTGIQAAWTGNDLNGLRAMTTPEMLSYFAEQLADLNSRGLHNKVTDVRLQQGDLSEAWQEGRLQYATVSMRFSMVDVTTDRAGRVTDGSPTERVTVNEFWTFLRAQGGHWTLSAIQQAR